MLIAEIGINHGGDMGRAKLMIEKAKAAGADVAKFQWYDPLKILGKDSPHLEEAKRCQFSHKQHLELKAHCDRVSIEWCVSAFHPEQVDAMHRAGMKRFKVASRAALDQKLLLEIAKTRKPVIVSTGMLGEAEKQALGVIFKDNPLTLLYCVCSYPASQAQIKLDEMLKLKKYCPNIGLSSHCPSIQPAMEAFSLGAAVIEQHVVLDRNQKGCDVSSSITFDDLKQLADIGNPLVRLLPVLTPEDVEWLRVQRSRPELYRYFRQDAPITQDQQRRWWKSVDKNTIRLFIVENKEGEKVGYAGFNPYLPRAAKAEFGLFIIPEHMNRGYGSAALNLLLKIGFNDLSLSTIYSDVLNYPGEHRFDYYKRFGFESFPIEHQTIRYRKQSKMISSIKFFMTKDMWGMNGKNRNGGLEPFAEKAAAGLQVLRAV